MIFYDGLWKNREIHKDVQYEEDDLVALVSQ
jgi:hypothetical protein